MPFPVLRGSALAYLQNYETDFDPVRGFIYRAEFKSISYDNILAVAQDFQRQGIACRVRFNQGGISSLVAEDATQTSTIDNWELVGNDERFDLLGHPTMQSFNLSTAQIAAYRSGVQSNTDAGTVFSGTSPLAPLVGTAVERFYLLDQKGTTEFTYPTYVLRHTTNVSTRWVGDPQDVLMNRNIGSIYTIGSLLTEIGSSLWFFPCPFRIANKISAIPPQTTGTSDAAFYQWGGLKSATTETTEANNRVRIATEYIIALWSTDLYPSIV